jgi:hypothetical protein
MAARREVTAYLIAAFAENSDDAASYALVSLPDGPLSAEAAIHHI